MHHWLEFPQDYLVLKRVFLSVPTPPSTFPLPCLPALTMLLSPPQKFLLVACCLLAWWWEREGAALCCAGPASVLGCSCLPGSQGWGFLSDPASLPRESPTTLNLQGVSYGPVPCPSFGCGTPLFILVCDPGPRIASCSVFKSRQCCFYFQLSPSCSSSPESEQIKNLSFNRGEAFNQGFVPFLRQQPLVSGSTPPKEVLLVSCSAPNHFLMSIQQRSRQKIPCVSANPLRVSSPGFVSSCQPTLGLCNFS